MCNSFLLPQECKVNKKREREREKNLKLKKMTNGMEDTKVPKLLFHSAIYPAHTSFQLLYACWKVTTFLTFLPK